MIPEPLQQLVARIDPVTGEISGAQTVRRRLSDMRGCYQDAAAYEAAVSGEDPLVYTVATIEPGTSEGDLHYGLGHLLPGRVGREYFMTKGHLHAWRPAAEVYLGLTGEGMMLLEPESGSDCVALPLRRNEVVYVPGHTAHRTVNIGPVPLVYLGIYPARAGHDYTAIASRNFSSVLVEQDGRPTLLRRGDIAPTAPGNREQACA
jgi:glucose-6-phosphate isomerase, archaeal